MRYRGTSGQREETRSREKEKERDGAEGGKVYSLLRHGIGGDVETALSSAETTGPKDVAGLRFSLSFLVSSFFVPLFLLSLSDPPTPSAGSIEAFFNPR